MRIVLISHRFLPNFLGGADLYTYHIADELRCQGHDVSIICAEKISDSRCPAGNVVARDEPYDGLPVHRFYFDWRSMPDPYSAFYVLNPAIEHATIAQLQTVRPDVVHITAMGHVSAGVLTAARILNLPVVLTLTGKWLICPLGSLLKRDGSLCQGRQDGQTCLDCMFGETKASRTLSQMPPIVRDLLLSISERSRVSSRLSESFGLLHAVDRRNRFFPRLLRDVDLVLSPSRCHQHLFADSGLFGGREIAYSPYGHRLELAAHGKLKRPSSRLRFGYTGQIVDYKGIDTAIEAFHRLQDTAGAELHIYGDPALNPPFMQYLRELAAGHPHIRFRGRYERSNIDKVLQDIDVVLVPSRCIENAPLTIAEAFAAKTPVLGSDTCGVAECIADGVNGFTFQRGDATDLAVQMERFLADRGLLDRLCRSINPPRTIADDSQELLQRYELVASRRIGRGVPIEQGCANASIVM